MSSERRNEARFDALMTLTMVGEHSKQRPEVTHTLDISQGGLQVLIDREPRPLERYHINIESFIEANNFEIVTEVRWSAVKKTQVVAGLALVDDSPNRTRWEKTVADIRLQQQDSGEEQEDLDSLIDDLLRDE